MKVLVYADTSVAGDAALEWLAVFASQMAVQATLLMAYDRVASGVTQLEPVVQFVRAHRGTVRIETTDGARASSAIVNEARRYAYDLIILSPSIRSETRSLIRGSRLSTVVRSVGASVLIAQPPAHTPKRVLVCVGGGAHSVVDAEVAARVAGAFDAQVVVLHIVAQIPSAYSGLNDLQHRMQLFLDSTAPGAQQLAQAEMILAAGGVDHELRVREGVVVNQIMDEIETGRYDLLVIGAHERSGTLLQFFLENLSEDLSHRSPIATLVVQSADGWRSGAT